MRPTHAWRNGISRTICLAIVATIAMFAFTATAFGQADTFLNGDGHDGTPPNFGNATFVPNAVAPVSGAVSAGATSLTMGTIRAGSGTGNVTFANSRLVLIVQSTGYSGTPTSGDQTAVNLGSSNVAKYEFARMTASGYAAPTLNFTAPLINSYDNGSTQVIAVPEYAAMNVTNAGAQILARAWDGTSGGVLAILVQGTMSFTAAGTVSANSLGFRGGVPYQDQTGNIVNCNILDGNTAGSLPAGMKGEGIYPSAFKSTSPPATVSQEGRGNYLNAGAGGNCFNASGGGGSNAGAGGTGGNSLAPYDGGRGVGGLGGAVMTYNPYDQILFGGGGGAGERNNNNPGGGGAGGGVVLVRGGTLTGTGNFRANGGAGTAGNTVGRPWDGAGGGGAGGVVVLRFVNGATCTGASANGGAGGNNASNGGNNWSPGGGGGGGRVYVQGSAVACPGAATAGANGTNGGNAYGATSGGAGATTSNATGLASPTVTLTAPANSSYQASTTPSVTGTSTNNATIYVYIDGVLNGTTTASGAGAWSYTPSALGQGSHTVYVRAQLNGISSANSGTNTFTVDTVAPVVSISSPTAGQYTNDNTPSATFSITEANLGTTTCATDGGAFSACSSPYTTASLTDGAHSISVRHTDLAGNAATTTVNFTVDTVNPVVTISAPTAGAYLTDNTPSATFSVTETNPGTTTCATDAGAFSACTSPYTTATLTDGAHSISVRHTDLAGNVTTTTRNFTIDTTNPVVTISSPTNGQYVNDNTPDVSFSITEANPGTTTCATDGGAFSACSSPYTTASLTDGAHSVSVRHVDLAGNTTTTTRNFTVDTTVPVVTISSPTNGQYVADNTPDVTFSITETNQGTTTCATDGGAFSACSSPYTTASLTDGAHSVAVRHVDLAGNSTTTTRNFNVDATTPVVTISSPAPSSVTSDTTPDISFSVTEANPGTTECSVDGGAYSNCSSPFTTGTLTDGVHSVSVRHTDLAGNAGTDSVVFAVDTTDPVVSILSPNENDIVNDPTPDISYSVADASSTTQECSVDGGAYGACTSPFNTGSLSDGAHSVAVRATDAAGNQGTTTRNFTVDATMPNVTISSPLDGASLSDATPDITFSVTDNNPGTTTCSTDGGAYAACSSPFTTASLSDGAHSVSVHHTDAAGNVATTTVNFTIDTAAPAAPAITSPAGSLTTNDTTPTISGTAEANSTVTIYDGVTVLGTTTADGSGNWSFTPGSPLSEGTSTVTATATDAAGNESADSASRAITIDTTNPVVAISSPTEGAVLGDSTPDITFNVTETNQDATECSVDGGAYSACSSPFTTSSLSDGAHSVTVRHTDDAGNTGSDTVSFNVDTVDPAAPTIDVPATDIATSDTTPALSGTAEANSLVTIYDGATPIGTTTADGSGDWSFTPGTPLSEGDHVITATATDAAGNEGPASASRTITIDTTDPVVTISSPTNGQLVADATPDVSFSVVDATATTTECSVDGGAYASCTDPFTTASLADGAHSVSVRATDAAGNQGTTTRNFNVDTTSPIVTISSPTGGAFLSDSTPTITFSVTEANPDTTECSVDGGAYSACSSPFTTGSLADGAHSVSVRHTDDAGNATTSTVNFTVDTTAPSAPDITTPAGDITTSDTTPAISGTAEANSLVTIYDGATPIGTTTADGSGDWSFTPGTPLTTGAHTITATSTDDAGNEGAASAPRVITIDTTDPVVAISAPADSALLADSTPDISFSVTDTNPDFTECSIDGGVYVSCTSPHTTISLADGAHIVTVRATDDAGNTGSDSVSFTIDTTLPVVAISAPAEGQAVADATPDITFSVTETNSGTTECSTDGGAFSACSSPFTTASLSDGAHNVTVRHTDAVGNVGSTTRNFIVDTTAPAVSITSPSNGAEISDATPTIAFTATDANPDVTECSVDGGAYTPCSSPFTTASLSDGPHSVNVRHTDDAGNTASDTVSFNIDTTDPAAAVITTPATDISTTDTTPSISGTAEANSLVTIYDNGSPIGTTTADGSGDWSFTPGSPLSEGANPFTATASDAAGNEGLASGTRTITIDTIDPVVAITSPTNGQVVNDLTPDIVFNVTDAGSTTTECSVDGGAYAACSSPFTTGSLSDGSHTVSVRATDEAGNTGTDSVTFTVDGTLPDVQITSPADGAFLSDSTPTITFTVTDDNPGTTECSVDGGAYSPCSSPFTTGSLAEGAHSVSVRHTDDGGNVGTAVVNFTVDTVDPAAPSIDSPVGDITTSDSTPTISGTAEANSLVTIYDNGSPIGTTTADGSGDWSFTPGTPLSEGAHPITATATDTAGNEGPASSSVTITVDTTNPVVAISAPLDGSVTADNTPSVTFSVTETNPDATECSVDGGAYTACSSPFATGTLTDGAHTVAVRHTDDAGNAGTDTVSFTVDATDPVVSISSPSDGAVLSDATPSISFNVTDATSTTSECSVDGGAFSACTSPSTTGSLSDGAHSVTVRATDEAGNQGADTVSFTVDTTPPAVSITSPSNGAEISDNTPTITFTATDDNPGTTECSVDGGAYAPCSSPFTTPSLSDGPHTVSVRHTDDGGNATTDTVSFNIDTTDPAAPNITTPAGDIATSDTTPLISGTAEPNSTVTIYDGPTAIGTATADGAGDWTFTPSSALSEGPHVITATATDAAGNEGPASSSRTITIDTTNPAVAISSPTEGEYVADATPDVSFNVTDDTATTTECSVDGGAFIACTSPFTTGSLTEGAHSVAVRATDAAGNQGTTTRNFIVDTTAPAVSITSPANGASISDSTPTITFTATDDNPGATECSVDGGAYAPCSSPFTTSTLSEGPHSVSVRHTDLAGNATVDSVSFTVDTVDPAAPIITTPATDISTSDTTPTISGTAEANSLVTIFDGGSPIGTTTADGSGDWSFTPGSPLSTGPHTITATSTDDAGNESVDSAPRVITIDTTDPSVSITAPSEGAVTGDNTPDVTFSVTDAGSTTTECSVDGGAYSACTSPFTTGSLSDGAHSVSVRATDEAGNTSTETRNFVVDTTNPVVAISAPTEGQVVSDSTPSVTFSVTETNPDSTECSVDGGAFSACTSPFTTGSLTDGAHSVTVRATDDAGNSGQSTRNFIVDTTNPAVNVTGPADGADLADNTPDITFTATDDNPGTTECSVDGGAFAPCSSPFTTPTLSDGPHSVTVRHTDEAGNAATDTVSFNVDTTDPAAPVITVPATNITTADSTPTISGTAEANSTVTLYDGVTMLGTTTADGSGDWTFTPGSSLVNGPHVITATSTDNVGNEGPASVSRTITIDSSDPVVAITSPADNAVLGDTTPSISFTVTDDTATTSECSVDGGAYSACASPFTTGTLTEGAHSVTVRATDDSSNQGSDTVNFTIDTTAPSVSITSPADGAQLSDNTPDIAFTATDAHPGTTECSVDGGAYAACSSPFTTPVLSDGPHTVAVRHTDEAGNAATDTVSFNVDTTDPAAPVITTPADDISTNDTTPQIIGTAEANSLVTIYDGAVPIGTTTADGSGDWTFTPGSPLATGPHTITATATDAAGNVSDPSNARVITIDTTDPVVSITAPANGSTIADNTPSVTFNVTDDGATTTECSVDGDAYAACTSPFTTSALGDGSHSVSVRAADAAGNVSSDSVSFTVDATDPAVAISAPTEGQVTGDATPSVTFSVTDDNPDTIECSVDGGAFSACTSPFTTGSLTDGAHSVTVRATDTVGNVGTATRNFIVDTTDPVVSITSPSNGDEINTDTPTITFSVTDSNPGTTECSVDGGAYAPCSSPFTTPSLGDGPHTVTVRHTDEGGNESSDSVSFNVDTTDPAAPVITVPVADITTSDTTPSISGTAEANSLVTIYDGPTAIGTAIADGSGDWNFTPGTALSEGPHVFTATATDAAGNEGAPSSSRTITVDTTDPAAPVITTPATDIATSDTTPTISGTAEANSTVTVYDGATPLGTTTADGSGDWSFTPGSALSSGDHTITATSTDAAGNVSDPSNARVITIDTTDPSVTITAPAPFQVLSDNTPSVSFIVGDDTATTTTCSIDGGAASSCTSPFTTSTLGDGPHNVSVTATDAAGNSASANVNFIVDTTAPSVNISSPSDGTTTGDNTPSISFTATDTNLDTVECSVDGGAYASCTSPFTTGTLSDGSHTVSVRATDDGGNSASDSVTFTVDTTAPTTSLDSTPLPDDPSNDPSFEFSSNEPGSTFACQLDGGGWVACASPHGYTDLADGPHTFEVRSIDPAGNPDPTPASFTWNIDTVAPNAPTIDSPADGTTTTDATPTISGTAEANSTVIVYNGASAIGSTTADGSGDWNFTPSSNLADGDYALTATATDAAGNEGAASNLVDLTIDTTPPNTTLTGTPTSPNNDNTPTFTFTATEGGSTFECSLDGAPFAPCTSPLTTSTLSDGSHTFAVRATDAVGNTDATPASHTWTVDTIAPAAPSITSPTEAQVINDNTPAITGTAEANSTVEVFIDGSSVGTTTANGSGAWTLTVSPALTDGAHTVRANATDAAGNTGADSTTVNFVVDTTAPSGDIVQVPGTGGPGEVPTFDLPTDDGTATLTCSLNGAPFTTCTAPFTPPANLPVGTHTLVVRFTDPAGNVTSRTLIFQVLAAAVNPTPLPGPDPACPADPESEPVVPAKISVTGATLSRKTLLKFNVTSDQFIIVRVTLKNGKKKIGSQARAINAGKRQVVMKIKKLPRNVKLTTRLSAVSMSGGKTVAENSLTADAKGKITVGSLDGTGGGGSTVTYDCGKEVGAPKLKVKVTANAKIKVGAKKLMVTATTTQLAVSTFKVIQNGKVIGRKVFLLTPGKKLKKPLKLLGGQKLAKGKATLQVSTFSVDGVRLKTTKKLKIK